MKNFIKKQTTIRVYPSSFLAGLEERMACINYMKQLRQRGFRGIFEVIYHDVNSHIILPLFGCPKVLPADFLDRKQKIRFVKFVDYYQRYMEGKITKVDLALTTVKNSQLKTHDTEDCHAVSANDAIMLNAKQTIAVSPYCLEHTAVNN